LKPLPLFYKKKYYAIVLCVNNLTTVGAFIDMILFQYMVYMHASLHNHIPLQLII